MSEYPKLTQFSPGAGCGCKISPADLEKILKETTIIQQDKSLLVGNQSKDDAAVYDLGDGRALISTTDFFTPIVDNPFDFGRIAATNAISDVYAMGGKPFLAIAILGWPLSKLPSEVAGRVIDGASKVCHQLQISLAGGHSIDISEPIFGLAVNGIVNITDIRKNNTAVGKCRILLTKPLGIGILTTAIKRALLSDEHLKIAVDLMCKANIIGYELANNKYVRAMTDVTGFGFLGHLLEMCEGSNLNAVIDYKSVPVIQEIYEYLEKNCIPGGTHRNWKSYGSKISEITEQQKLILCDPQTSGGLLVAVEPEGIQSVKLLCNKYGFDAVETGYFKKRNIESEKFIRVE